MSRFLPCKLTEVEIRERGVALAKLTQDIKATEDRHASVKSQLKSELGVLQAQQAKIAGCVSRGEESRDVRVEIVYDYSDLSVTEYRTDTGERINSRTMTEEERQIPLPV